MKPLSARLLMVGNELLSGRTVDTNASAIARALFDAGVTVTGKETLPDEEGAIAKAVKETKEDILILSGGLGPTPDDLTRNGLAAAFGVKLFTDAHQIRRITKFFKRVKRPMAACNATQAEVPEGFKAVDNPYGTAPALFKTKPFIMALPGVPREVNGLLKDVVLPYIRRQFKCPPIHIEEIFTTGIGESSLYERIDDLVKVSEIGFSSLPEISGVLLRFYGQDKKAVIKIADAARARCSDFIYGKNGDTLQGVLHQLCKKNKLTVSIAESCTGGMLASRIVSVPGSSAWFLGGAVTYHNSLKEKWLGVKPSTLKTFGAVSEQTAEEMAIGVRKKTGSDLALSITGIAGPDGGTAEKPVGTVYMAVSSDSGRVSHSFNFFGSREAIRERAVASALFILFQACKKK